MTVFMEGHIPAEPDSVQPLLAAEHLSKRFGQRVAVQDVSLSVHPGEIITIIGPNGSGKTTLLRMLLGLTPESGGRITRRKGLRIGYVPQKAPIEPLMPITVEWFLLQCARYPSKASGRLFTQLIERLGIGGLMARQMAQLSGGEAQRVMLMQALLQRPELLVLDEPVQGVDITGQSELYALIRQLSREIGCAVLMVSHDLHLVMSSTDRVICLNQHVCCEGSPQQVQQDPSFTRLFGEDVARQLAIYHHEHDHAHHLGVHVHERQA